MAPSCDEQGFYRQHVPRIKPERSGSMASRFEVIPAAVEVDAAVAAFVAANTGALTVSPPIVLLISPYLYVPAPNCTTTTFPGIGCEASDTVFHVWRAFVGFTYWPMFLFEQQHRPLHRRILLLLNGRRKQQRRFSGLSRCVTILMLLSRCPYIGGVSGCRSSCSRSAKLSQDHNPAFRPYFPDTASFFDRMLLWLLRIQSNSAIISELLHPIFK